MRIHRYGDVSVIRHDEVPRPAPGDGEVVLRVTATSFNPSEVGLRRGLLRSVLPLDLPYTLGSDVAGTVTELGTGCTCSPSGIGQSAGSTAAQQPTTPSRHPTFSSRHRPPSRWPTPRPS